MSGERGGNPIGIIVYGFVTTGSWATLALGFLVLWGSGLKPSAGMPPDWAMALGCLVLAALCGWLGIAMLLRASWAYQASIALLGVVSAPALAIAMLGHFVPGIQAPFLNDAVMLLTLGTGWVLLLMPPSEHWANRE